MLTSTTNEKWIVCTIGCNRASKHWGGPLCPTPDLYTIMIQCCLPFRHAHNNYEDCSGMGLCIVKPCRLGQWIEWWSES